MYRRNLINSDFFVRFQFFFLQWQVNILGLKLVFNSFVVNLKVIVLGFILKFRLKKVKISKSCRKDK